jgi:hypothetical protein
MKRKQYITEPKKKYPPVIEMRNIFNNKKQTLTLINDEIGKYKNLSTGECFTIPIGIAKRNRIKGE